MNHKPIVVFLLLFEMTSMYYMAPFRALIQIRETSFAQFNMHSFRAQIQKPRKSRFLLNNIFHVHEFWETWFSFIPHRHHLRVTRREFASRQKMSNNEVLVDIRISVGLSDMRDYIHRPIKIPFGNGDMIVGRSEDNNSISFVVWADGGVCGYSNHSKPHTFKYKQYSTCLGFRMLKIRTDSQNATFRFRGYKISVASPALGPSVFPSGRIVAGFSASATPKATRPNARPSS
jgi:hypothetical protein